MPLSQEFPNHRERRRELRQEATLAENLLWRHLRRKQFEGLKFRRQHQLGPYIVDFYSSAARLVIEVDGGQHYEPEVEQYDRERTAYFEQRGLRVLRFTNLEVTSKLDGVVEAILELIGSPSP
ncbi:MAG: endonuclease domain-containing protein [Dehalococcoidia bacterium]